MLCASARTSLPSPAWRNAEADLPPPSGRGCIRGTAGDHRDPQTVLAPLALHADLLCTRPDNLVTPLRTKNPPSRGRVPGIFGRCGPGPGFEVVGHTPYSVTTW
ncbi:hypothetical protein L209DRAFT_311668 [Thermothelomyces heterothallicus CBS 203.75]